MRPPSPIAAHPQGFLQSKNALRRTNATKFAARQEDRQTFYKPVGTCMSERECFQNTQAHSTCQALQIWNPRDLKRAAALLFPKESRGNPFEGFPLGNFFLTADAVLLCAAKKNGVGTTRLAGSCQLSSGACRHGRQKQKVPLAGTAEKAKKEPGSSHCPAHAN